MDVPHFRTVCFARGIKLLLFLLRREESELTLCMAVLVVFQCYDGERIAVIKLRIKRFEFGFCVASNRTKDSSAIVLLFRGGCDRRVIRNKDNDFVRIQTHLLFRRYL